MRFITSIRSLAALVVLLPWLIGAGPGCPNVYGEFADTTTPEALLYKAKRDIDAGKYDDAIAAIEEIPAASREGRDYRLVLASAHAGKCGLDMIGLSKNMSDGFAVSKSLFTILLESFRAVSDTAADSCTTAESVLLNVPEAELRPDDYVFLAFIGLAKVGSILARTADTVDNDGVYDGTFNACSSASIDDTNLSHLSAGLMLALNSLTAANSSIGETGMTSLTSLCTSLDGYGANFCTKTSAGDYTTSSEWSAIRHYILSNEIGLNICGGTFKSGGACDCPP